MEYDSDWIPNAYPTHQKGMFEETREMFHEMIHKCLPVSLGCASFTQRSDYKVDEGHLQVITVWFPGIYAG